MQPVEEEEKPEEEPEEELSEADLPRLQAEVNDLQQAFDQAVVEKHSLHMELQSMNERLKAASEMVERWGFVWDLRILVGWGGVPLRWWRGELHLGLEDIGGVEGNAL